MKFQGKTLCTGIAFLWLTELGFGMEQPFIVPKKSRKRERLRLYI